jgi:probable addiction module antidote protein
MKKCIPFENDLKERLRDIEVAKTYLNECLSDWYAGSEQDFFEALGHVSKAFGISKIAAKKKIPRSSVYKALKEGANPSFITVVQILDALGIQTSFVSKGKEKAQNKQASGSTNLDETIKNLVLEVINEQLGKRQIPKAS